MGFNGPGRQVKGHLFLTQGYLCRTRLSRPGAGGHEHSAPAAPADDRQLDPRQTAVQVCAAERACVRARMCVWV